jgi:hypothetical protein
MATWTIRGEDGAGLDDTSRTIQSLGIDSANLEFATLAADEFRFSMRTTTADGKGTDGVKRIPSLGQEISLFKDGDRKFVGHAVAPEVDLDRVTVTARGPWEWMSRIPVSSVKSGAVDVGADGERPSYAFPEQNLRTSLMDLNNAARTAGVPVKKIETADQSAHMSAMFTILTTTVSSKSWADALTDLMAWCVDGVAWYDHSGTGNAQFKVTRRDAMSPLTLTVGSNMTECKIRPRMDLRVIRTELHFVTRNQTTGRPRWAKQYHGAVVPGHVQMVAVSGPDVAVLVPPDDYDSVVLKTKAAKFYGSDYFAYDSVLKSAQEKYGGLTANLNFSDYPGWNIILSGQTADWMRKERGLKSKSLKVSGWVGGTYNHAAGSGGSGACGSYLKSIGRMTSWVDSNDVGRVSLYVDFTIPVINLSYPSTTTVYKKWTYKFLTPPADLAQNLRDSQNWVPWEGQIVVVGDEVSGDNRLNRKIRLNGSLSVCEDMDALLKKVTYDIIGGRTTYTLGPPARTDFGSMIRRIARQAADNIKYL